MRLLETSNKASILDINHPLAGKALQVDIHIGKIKSSRVERGGRCSSWLEDILENGPGLQARWHKRPTIFTASERLPRQDETDDPHFYTTPRLVHHVDELASSFISQEYEKIIMPGSRILDLMSSFYSHLPARDDLKVTGLGLNETEMAANNVLSRYLVHDLNRNPELPFDDASFHTVLCSLSVEYLSQPGRVIQDVARVLAPGGTVVFSFSNRWFPPKVTRLWLELHEFERMGFVLEYLLRDTAFENCATASYRNWPRPETDRHYGNTFISDPVFLVSASKRR